MRIDLCESIIRTGINQDGAVAGREDFNIGMPGQQTAATKVTNRPGVRSDVSPW